MNEIDAKGLATNAQATYTSEVDIKHKLAKSKSSLLACVVKPRSNLLLLLMTTTMLKLWSKHSK